MQTVMTREELRQRCQALAGVGDKQAAATLNVLEQVDRLEKQAMNSPLTNTADDLAFRANVKYIIDGLNEKLKLAVSLGLTGGPVSGFVEIPEAAFEAPQKPVDEEQRRKAVYTASLCHRIAQVCNMARLKSEPSVIGTPDAPSEDIPNWIRSYIQGFGEMNQRLEHLMYICRIEGVDTEMPQDWDPGAESRNADTEAEAIAESRRRMGLTATQDPAVTAVNPATAAGHWNQTPKMGSDLDGKKAD